MTKLSLSLILFFVNLTGYCTIWTITDTGLKFSPATITIRAGDTVNFVLAPSHDAKSVGGFQIPFGGGMVLPALLPVGTHEYSCTPHAHAGMLGTIIVQNTLETLTGSMLSSFSIYPNPSNGNFQFAFDNSELDKNCRMEIFNVKGELVLTSQITSKSSIIDLSNQAKGVYIIKIDNRSTIYRKEMVVQ